MGYCSLVPPTPKTASLVLAFRWQSTTTRSQLSTSFRIHPPPSGLSSGLLVERIDGTLTVGKILKECTDLLRGAAGTKIKLELIDTDHSKTNTVELIREEIKQ